MNTDLDIRSADRVRDGVLVGFSDGLVVLFPTTFLLELRDRQETMRIPDGDEG